MNPSILKTAAVVLLFGFLCFLPARAANAIELKKEAAAAYDRYIAASEAKMKREIQNGPFLFVDALPENSRRDAYAELRGGEVQTMRRNTDQQGQPALAAQALIHDWIGVVFIPNVSLAQALGVVQDYGNYQDYYKPGMRHSRVISRTDDKFDVSLQLYRKSVITVVVNAEFEIEYRRLGASRVVTHSRATRLAEVQNAGQPGEHELPPGASHGLIWRLNDYWRFEEKDGGVYVQLESIGLSRSVPSFVAWLVNPLLNSIPRGVLLNLLSTTRTAVVNSRKAAANPDKSAP
jgi:hypothetical protein